MTPRFSFCITRRKRQKSFRPELCVLIYYYACCVCARRVNPIIPVLLTRSRSLSLSRQRKSPRDCTRQLLTLSLSLGTTPRLTAFVRDFFLLVFDRFSLFLSYIYANGNVCAPAAFVRLRNAHCIFPNV